jgi:hypothetical protein
MDTPNLDHYKQLLKAHDWHYAYSDDHRVWLKGEKERNELLKLANTLDPKLELYNQARKEARA